MQAPIRRLKKESQLYVIAKVLTPYLPELLAIVQRAPEDFAISQTDFFEAIDNINARHKLEVENAELAEREEGADDLAAEENEVGGAGHRRRGGAGAAGAVEFPADGADNIDEENAAQEELIRRVNEHVDDQLTHLPNPATTNVVASGELTLPSEQLLLSETAGKTASVNIFGGSFAMATSFTLPDAAVGSILQHYENQQQGITTPPQIGEPTSGATTAVPIDASTHPPQTPQITVASSLGSPSLAPHGAPNQAHDLTPQEFLELRRKHLEKQRLLAGNRRVGAHKADPNAEPGGDGATPANAKGGNEGKAAQTVSGKHQGVIWLSIVTLVKEESELLMRTRTDVAHLRFRMRRRAGRFRIKAIRSEDQAGRGGMGGGGGGAAKGGLGGAETADGTATTTIQTGQVKGAPSSITPTRADMNAPPKQLRKLGSAAAAANAAKQQGNPSESDAALKSNLPALIPLVGAADDSRSLVSNFAGALPTLMSYYDQSSKWGQGDFWDRGMPELESGVGGGGSSGPNGRRRDARGATQDSAFYGLMEDPHQQDGDNLPDDARVGEEDYLNNNSHNLYPDIPMVGSLERLTADTPSRAASGSGDSEQIKQLLTSYEPEVIGSGEDDGGRGGQSRDPKPSSPKFENMLPPSAALRRGALSDISSDSEGNTRGKPRRKTIRPGQSHSLSLFGSTPPYNTETANTILAMATAEDRDSGSSPPRGKDTGVEYGISIPPTPQSAYLQSITNDRARDGSVRYMNQIGSPDGSNALMPRNHSSSSFHDNEARDTVPNTAQGTPTEPHIGDAGRIERASPRSPKKKGGSRSVNVKEQGDEEQHDSVSQAGKQQGLEQRRGGLRGPAAGRGKGVAGASGAGGRTAQFQTILPMHATGQTNIRRNMRRPRTAIRCRVLIAFLNLCKDRQKYFRSRGEALITTEEQREQLADLLENERGAISRHKFARKYMEQVDYPNVNAVTRISTRCGEVIRYLFHRARWEDGAPSLRIIATRIDPEDGIIDDDDIPRPLSRYDNDALLTALLRAQEVSAIIITLEQLSRRIEVDLRGRLVVQGRARTRLLQHLFQKGTIKATVGELVDRIDSTNRPRNELFSQQQPTAALVPITGGTTQNATVAKQRSSAAALSTKDENEVDGETNVPGGARAATTPQPLGVTKPHNLPLANRPPPANNPNKALIQLTKGDCDTLKRCIINIIRDGACVQPQTGGGAAGHLSKAAKKGDEASESAFGSNATRSDKTGSKVAAETTTARGVGEPLQSEHTKIYTASSRVEASAVTSPTGPIEPKQPSRQATTTNIPTGYASVSAPPVGATPQASSPPPATITVGIWDFCISWSQLPPAATSLRQARPEVLPYLFPETSMPVAEVVRRMDTLDKRHIAGGTESASSQSHTLPSDSTQQQFPTTAATMANAGVPMPQQHQQQKPPFTFTSYDIDVLRNVLISSSAGYIVSKRDYAQSYSAKNATGGLLYLKEAVIGYLFPEEKSLKDGPDGRLDPVKPRKRQHRLPYGRMFVGDVAAKIDGMEFTLESIAKRAGGEATGKHQMKEGLDDGSSSDDEDEEDDPPFTLDKLDRDALKMILLLSVTERDYSVEDFIDALQAEVDRVQHVLDPLEITLYLFPQEEMEVDVVRTLISMTAVPPKESHFTHEYYKLRAKREIDIHSLVLYIPLVIFFLVVVFSGRGLSSDMFVAYGMGQGFETAIENTPFARCSLEQANTTTTNATLTTTSSFSLASGNSTSARWIVCNPDDAATLADIGEPQDLISVLAGFVPTILWPAEGLATDASGTRVATSMSPVGAIRIRQKRVNVETKEIVGLSAESLKGLPAKVREASEVRYPPYAPADASNAPHTSASNSPIIQSVTGPVWDGTRHGSCDDLNSTVSYKGQNVYFDCGGHAIQIPFRSTKGQYYNVISELLGSGWIDQQTRAIIVEYLLFHERSGMVLMAKHAFEIPAGGGLPFTSLGRPFFPAVRDPFLPVGVLICYIFFVVTLVYLTLQYIFDLVTDQMVHITAASRSASFTAALLDRFNVVKYFAVANIPRYTTTVLSLANICLFIYQAIMFRGVSWNKTTPDALWQLDYYPAGMEEGYRQFETITIISATNIIISLCLILRMTKYMPRFVSIVSALQRAVQPAVALGIVVVALAFGCGVCGNVIWGHYIVGYHNVMSATLSLLSSYWYGINFEELRLSDQFAFSYLFIIFYDWLTVVFFLSVIVAIITDAFSDVRNRMFNPLKLKTAVETDPHRTLQKITPFTSAFRYCGYLLISALPARWRISSWDDYSYHNYYQCLDRDMSLLDDVDLDEQDVRETRWAASARLLALLQNNIAVPHATDPEPPVGGFTGASYTNVQPYGLLSPSAYAAAAIPSPANAVRQQRARDGKPEGHHPSPLHEVVGGHAGGSGAVAGSPFGDRRNTYDFLERDIFGSHLDYLLTMTFSVLVPQHRFDFSGLTMLIDAAVAYGAWMDDVGVRTLEADSEAIRALEQLVSDYLSGKRSGRAGDRDEDEDNGDEIAALSAALTTTGYLYRRLLLGVLACADRYKYFGHETFFSEELFVVIADELDVLPKGFNYKMYFKESGLGAVFREFSIRMVSFLPFIKSEFSVSCLGCSFRNADMMAFDREAYERATKSVSGAAAAPSSTAAPNANPLNAQPPAPNNPNSFRYYSFFGKSFMNFFGAVPEEKQKRPSLEEPTVPATHMARSGIHSTDIYGRYNINNNNNNSIVAYPSFPHKEGAAKQPSPTYFRNSPTGGGYPPGGTSKQQISSLRYLSEEDFIDAHTAATGKPPSSNTLVRVKTLFPDGAIDWQFFVHACQLDPFSQTYRSFEAHFAGMMVHRDDFLLWFVIQVPLMVCVFLLALTGYMGEYVTATTSLRTTFSPSTDVGGYALTQITDWLTSVFDTVWDDTPLKSGAGIGGIGANETLRMHQDSNYYIRSLRIFQARGVPIDKDTCDRYWEAYFGDDAGSRRLRFRVDESVSAELRDFYDQRVSRDFGNTYAGRCLTGWGSGAHELKEDFIPTRGNLSRKVFEAFEYAKEDPSVSTLAAEDFTAAFQAYYPPRGFFIDIPFNYSATDAKGLLRELLDAGWLDDRTRMVMVKLVTFNANMQVFVSTRAGYELTPGGLIAPFSRVFTVANTVLSNTQTVVLSTFMWFFILWFLYLKFREILHMGDLWAPHTRFPYVYASRLVLITPSALYDIAVVAIIIVVWSWQLFVRFSSLEYELTSDIYEADSYPQRFEWICAVSDTIRTLEGCNLLFMTARFIFIITASLKIDLILKAFFVSVHELMAVFLLFVLSLIAFALCGQLWFGYAMDNSRTFQASLVNMVVGASMGGDIHIGMPKYRDVAAPIYEVLFLLICTFVLYSMWTAIMTDALSEVKASQYDPFLAEGSAATYAYWERSETSEAIMYKWTFLEWLSARDGVLEALHRLRVLKRWRRRRTIALKRVWRIVHRKISKLIAGYRKKRVDRGESGNDSEHRVKVSSKLVTTPGTSSSSSSSSSSDEGPHRHEPFADAGAVRHVHEPASAGSNVVAVPMGDQAVATTFLAQMAAAFKRPQGSQQPGPRYQRDHRRRAPDPFIRIAPDATDVPPAGSPQSAQSPVGPHPNDGGFDDNPFEGHHPSGQQQPMSATAETERQRKRRERQARRAKRNNNKSTAVTIDGAAKATDVVFVDTNLIKRANSFGHIAELDHTDSDSADSSDEDFDDSFNTIEEHCFSLRKFWQSMHRWWFAVDVGSPRAVAEAAGMIFTVQALTFPEALTSGSGGVSTNVLSPQQLKPLGQTFNAQDGPSAPAAAKEGMSANPAASASGGPLGLSDAQIDLTSPGMAAMLRRASFGRYTQSPTPLPQPLSSQVSLLVGMSNEDFGKDQSLPRKRSGLKRSATHAGTVVPATPYHRESDNEDANSDIIGNEDALSSTHPSVQLPLASAGSKSDYQQSNRDLQNPAVARGLASTTTALPRADGESEEEEKGSDAVSSNAADEDDSVDSAADSDAPLDDNTRLHTYGRFRRLPIWNEFLFIKFKGAYANIRDNLIDIPAALFGADGERLWLRALEDKHYFELERRKYVASATIADDSDEDEDDDSEVDE